MGLDPKLRRQMQRAFAPVKPKSPTQLGSEGKISSTATGSRPGVKGVNLVLRNLTIQGGIKNKGLYVPKRKVF